MITQQNASDWLNSTKTVDELQNIKVQLKTGEMLEIATMLKLSVGEVSRVLNGKVVYNPKNMNHKCILAEASRRAKSNLQFISI